MKKGVSYLKFMMLILKLRSFWFVFVGDGKLFLSISQMLVASMYMLLLQLSYIFLFCFREWSSQKYKSDPEGCPVDWQELMIFLKCIWLLFNCNNIFHLYKNVIVIQERVKHLSTHAQVEWRNTGDLTTAYQNPHSWCIPNVNTPLILHNELY